MKVLGGLAAAARRREAATIPRAPRRAPSLAAVFARPGLIAELKPASPTEGRMRAMDAPDKLARRLLDAGACGISALTEPTRFGGSPGLLQKAVGSGGPVLMKDFIVTERQLDLAQAAGASAVLLIQPLLSPGYSEWQDADEAIAAAHVRGLETLLEVYDEAGYAEASATESDLIGINNRDLRDDALPVDARTTPRVLARHTPRVPTLALSGIKTAADIRAQIESGARGVLVGTTLMRSADPAAKLEELLEGLT